MADVTMVKYAPMGDPVEVRIHSYELTLRLADAAQIQIDNVRDEKEQKRGSRVRAIPHPGLGEGGKYHEKADEHPLPDSELLTFALAGKPDLLVLDEPTNGLDPQGIVEMRELILKLNRERQITVLISSHILDELSRLATHYGFIDKGTIVKEITAEELENTCRKCVKLQVTDTAVLAHILDKRGLEYEILSDTQANVYGELVVSDVALELAEQNCRMFSVQEYEESLESYYLNLVGGGKHE